MMFHILGQLPANLSGDQAPSLPPLPEGPSLDHIITPDSQDATGLPLPLTFAFIVGFILLVVVAFYLWRSRQRQRPAKDPADQAFDQLQELQRNQQEPKALSTGSVKILRHYLSLKYGSRILSSTSAELLDYLGSRSQLSPNLQTQLADFLRKTDTARFGKKTSPSLSKDNPINEAKQLIASIEAAETVDQEAP